MNDYFQGFKFGSSLKFDVSLFGPALSSPDGVSTSGSAFAFSMFSNSAGTIAALTTNTTDGFAFTIDVNLDGSTTLTDYSNQSNVSAPTGTVPEPASVFLAGTIIASIGLRQRQKRRRPGFTLVGPLNVAGTLASLRRNETFLSFGCGLHGLQCGAATGRKDL